MRYSKVLSSFYRISLSDVDRDLLDCAFTAASHHFLMLRLCRQGEERTFHLLRHRAHLQWLMSIVYLRGDFTKARDESLRGLERRSQWNPNMNFSLPDPKMFNSMNPDPSCGIGQPHPSDWYLDPHDLAVELFLRGVAN